MRASITYNGTTSRPPRKTAFVIVVNGLVIIAAYEISAYPRTLSIAAAAAPRYVIRITRPTYGLIICRESNRRDEEKGSNGTDGEAFQGFRRRKHA